MRRQFFKKYRLRFLGMVLLSAAGTAPVVFGPRILGAVTTEIFSGIMAKLSGTGGIDFPAVSRILRALAGLYLAGAACGSLQRLATESLRAGLAAQLRTLAVRRLGALPVSWFEQREGRELLPGLPEDIGRFADCVTRGVCDLVSPVVTVAGIAVMVAWISHVMAVIVFLSLFLSFAVMKAAGGRTSEYVKRQQDCAGCLQEQAEAAFDGRMTVASFAAESRMEESFAVQSRELGRLSARAGWLDGIRRAALGLVANLGYIAALFAGAGLASGTAAAVGEIQAVLHYIHSLTQPAGQLAGSGAVLQEAKACARRIFALLETQGEEDYAPQEELPPQQGMLEFSHVSFGYGEDLVLRDFCAVIRPGEHVALVGKTGAGKTTIARLLLRFYDVSEGAVYVDGQDVRRYNRSQLRRRFAVVTQDAWLSGASVRENIRYGRPEASDGEVEEAARSVCAHSFIETLPQGYDTVLDADTVCLSNGQMQLLMIARAVLADREFLILDEATGSVDTRTERMVCEALDRLMKGRTCLIIAHRPSAIRSASRVIELT